MLHVYGWKPDSPDFRDLLLAPPPPTETLPPVVNLEPKCPGVYDQGQYGSCTYNATGAALEFDQMKQGCTVFTPSRFFGYWWERFLEHDTQQDGGGQLRDAMKATSKYGYLPETDWPYIPANLLAHPSAAACKEALTRKDVLYQRVAQTEAALKATLASGFPVVFGFTVYDSFESPQVAKTGIAPMPGRNDSPVGGHAVLLVGYDDRTQQWRVRNSWGTSWGQAGYCVFDYAYLTTRGLASDFWTIQHVPAG
jgi:C1A family cysteine protease